MKFKKIAALAVPAATMILIFYFSAQTASVSTETSGSFAKLIARIFCGMDDLYTGEQEWVIDTLQSVIRKGAHFTIYAFLGFSLANYIRLYNKKYWIAPIICLAYAISDEFHQYFVEGRSCEITDVLLDFSGGIMGTLLFVLIAKIVRRIKNGWSV